LYVQSIIYKENILVNRFFVFSKLTNNTFLKTNYFICFKQL